MNYCVNPFRPGLDVPIGFGRIYIHVNGNTQTYAVTNPSLTLGDLEFDEETPNEADLWFERRHERSH